MLDYQYPYGPSCYSDSLFGIALASFILFFYQKIWWIISGIAWKGGDLYLTFLLIFGLNSEYFLHYTFSQILREDRPLCTFTVPPMNEHGYAMPSLEAQLTASIASFLVLHMFLMKRLTKMRATLAIVTFPILTIFSLYITRNNTFAQLAVGFIFGAINGTLRILIYHFFIKRPLALLGTYSPLDWVIPSSPLTLTKYEDLEDQTTLMLGEQVAFAEMMPVEEEAPESLSETVFHEFSGVVVGPFRRAVAKT